MTKFAGFGEHAVEFYDGLSADNSKAYWADHVEVYRSDVRAPMEALIAELTPEFGPGFGEGKVFRPYRDVRFARDKTPYKTHCGGVVEQGRGGGAYYVEVSSAGLRVGGGASTSSPTSWPASGRRSAPRSTAPRSRASSPACAGPAGPSPGTR